MLTIFIYHKRKKMQKRLADNNNIIATIHYFIRQHAFNLSIYKIDSTWHIADNR